MISTINYIFKNLKQFAMKSTMIFVLFIVCEISAVLIILFSYGTFNHFQTQKEIESIKIDQQQFSIAFGNIVDTVKDESGKILYYNGDGTITVDELRQVLNLLDDKTKSRLPGLFFRIDNTDPNFMEYINKDDDEEVVIAGSEDDDYQPTIDFRLEFNEDLNEYSLYNEYLDYSVSMLKGRYFTYEEYAGDEPLIVLPSNAKEELLGKKISFLGKEYKVIGFLRNSSIYDFTIPFKTVSGDNVIKEISLLHNKAIMTEDYYTLRNAFVSVIGDKVLFPPVNTVDFSDIRFYISIMFISIAIALASAINLAILFRYILNSRLKQMAVFMLTGSTRNKIRRLYISEILMISVIIFVIFSCIYHFLILPKLTLFFKYVAVVYNLKTYLVMFGIYIMSIYVFINIVIMINYKKSPVELLKERGR